MIASRAVTVTQTSAPSASARIHREPVEPWNSSRSPSLAKPVGITSGPSGRLNPT